MAETRGGKKCRSKLTIYSMGPHFLSLKKLKLECFPAEERKCFFVQEGGHACKRGLVSLPNVSLHHLCDVRRRLCQGPGTPRGPA